jgi:hypothetical protein
MRLSYVLSFVRVVGLASSGTLNVYTQESYFILLYEAILNLSSKMLYLLLTIVRTLSCRTQTYLHE